MDLSDKQRYLTDHGIKLLREFLWNHGVKAVDIQIEFLDHYAILIEEELNRDRSLDFRDALHIVHKKSGGNEQLRKLVKTKTKAIDQYWKRRIRSFMKGYFEWPKIVIFFSITLFFILITHNQESLYNKQSTYTAFGFSALSTMALVFIMYRRLRNDHVLNYTNRLHTYDSFLYRFQLLPLFNVICLLQIWVICPTWFPDNETPALLLLIIMSCISAYELLLAHAFETKFQYWIKEEIENKYPEHIHLLRA